MKNDNRQKVKLLHLIEILKQETDPEHPLKTAQLCAKLKDLGITCDRRTLSRDISALQEFDYPIRSSFPLISAGIFGYPKDQAWRKALQACQDFIDNDPDYDIDIIFAVLDDRIMALGEKVLDELQNGKSRTTLTSKVQDILQADSDEELRKKLMILRSAR